MRTTFRTLRKALRAPRALLVWVARPIYRFVVRFEARVWLNNAWLRNQDCLVADLEAIERRGTPARKEEA